MKKDHDLIPALMAPRKMPDPKVFLAEVRQSVTDAGWFQSLMRDAEELRTCYWPGQKSDGRKHGTQNQRARPWENAADHRVPVLLQLMQERTAVRSRAMRAAKISITGRTVDDGARASLLEQVVKYYLGTLMGRQVHEETKLWSNWSQNYGHAVLFVGWKTERQLEERSVTLLELQQYAAAVAVAAAMQGAQAENAQLDESAVLEIEQAATLGVIVQLESPEGQTELAELLLEMDPDLAGMGRSGKAEALRAVKRLAAGREGEYLAPFTKCSAPYWEALQPYVDVFYPTETRKLQESRWVARVRWMDEVELRSWAAEEDLDEEWLRQVLKHPGRTVDIAGLAEWVLSASSTRMSTRPEGYGDASRPRNYQVMELYWRAQTTYGVPVLYRTVAHGMVQDRFGKHEVCKHYHGRQPFFDLREEHWSKLLLDSRGVPEIFGTAQHALKTQWDSRTDAASMATLPPMRGPAGSTPPAIGPGIFVEDYRSGSVDWMRPPTPDSRSIEIEQTVLTRLNRFYGLMSDQVPEPLQILMQGTLSDEFLSVVQEVMRVTVQLIQQYTPDLMGARITGTEEYVTATREEIQGMFDVEISWDVRDLSLEWVEKKIKLYTDMLMPLDNRGEIDRGQLMLLAAEAVDPLAARRIVRPRDQAQRQERDEEEAALSAIFSGGLPEFIVGTNHELRAQVMQEDLAKSPMRQDLLSVNANVAAVWEDRLQRHLFQLEQEQNKVVGIQGGSDPLRQSPLARLKANGWRAFAGPGAEAGEAGV